MPLPEEEKRMFHYAHASGEHWQDIAQKCLDRMGQLPAQANLGFLYATDLLADHMEAILAHFRAHTGVQHWVGTVGVGICGNGREYYDVPALAVMVGDFPQQSFQVIPTISKDLRDFQRTHRSWYSGKQALFGIIHGDPRNHDLPELLENLAEDIDGFLVGGLTSSRKSYAQIADGITDGGLSGVLFSNEVAVSTRLTQGCSPIGERHEITECQNNIIISLDDRPALEVFKQDIGPELANDLNRVGGYIFVALPIAGSDTGDYLVRNLIGLDPQNELIAVGESLTPGMQLLFTRRDSATAREDLARMLGSLRRGLSKPPRGGVYYSCLGRGQNLFGENSEELNLIREVLGEFPLVGFFANGEISHNRLYGYTGVLSLFL
jgi:small ligand-binding sensory domain FIST